MTVEVKWDATNDGVYVTDGGRGGITTLLPGEWAQRDGISAAAAVCEDFFTAKVWEEWIGLDDTKWTVVVEITLPKGIAGWYEVEMERVVKASATKARPPEYLRKRV